MEYTNVIKVGKTSSIYFLNTLKKPKINITDIGGTSAISKNNTTTFMLYSKPKT